MTIDLSTALSGISAANERLRASASNIAGLADANQKRTQVNLSTVATGGVRADTVLTDQTVQPTNELVEQQAAAYTFVANLRVLQTQLRAEGTVLDIKA
jgi:hypothetical protein